MEPFASVSNLANLSVDIPLGLQDQGNDVRCLMPKYGFISERTVSYTHLRAHET